MEKVNNFAREYVWPLSERSTRCWEEGGGWPNKLGTAKEFMHNGVPLIVHDSEPAEGLKIAEFCAEVLFPYHFNAVYDSLTMGDVGRLQELGTVIDPQGRPEAVMDLKYGTAEGHYASLQSIKPLLKLLPKMDIRANEWHYDHEFELANICYHMEKDGLTTDKAFEYHGQDYYRALADLSVDEGLWRWDYWYDNQFVGHSLWAESPDRKEWYWILPVMARTPLARKKLRIGNMMMLHAIQLAYQCKVERINFGVDEMDYKSAFWNTRRVYRPGLRRIEKQNG